jgi:diguanylate cyclase (GGDEF)-like protein
MIPVTITLGVAASGNETGAEVNALIQAADRACYQAKEKGRTRVEVAAETDN